MQVKRNRAAIKITTGLLILCFFLSSGKGWAQTPKDMLIAPASSAVRNTDTAGQHDLIGIFLHVTRIHIKHPLAVDGRRVYYSLLPLSTSVPGGGTALITSTTAGFYLGNRKETYISSATFSPSFNFRGQFNFPIRANIWSANNAWNYQMDTRFSIYPLFTWGLGGKQPEDHRILLRYKYYRMYASALKKITPYLLAGAGYSLDYDIHIRPDVDTVSIQQFTGYKYGTVNHSNAFSSGLTLNLLYDTRNNSINPLPGAYFNMVYRVNTQFLGSNTNWHSLYLDARKYISFSEKGQNVLALWSYFWTTLGSNPPYLQLPGIGQEPYQRSGRGFYPSRYVGKTLFYFETEYRKDITNDGLFGFVLFANLNTVTEPHTANFAYLHPAAGPGLRIKFNKHSGTNVGIDYGFSKGYNAVYFNLGETF
ncbi:MAG TPA: BamA/TamA family outer membrane protein [Puia sp.]|nr:BamA/TamA family outer membrane protein [Puia sp.]